MKSKQIKLTCENCGKIYMGEEPRICCNGDHCGCMGLPIDPILCESCEEEFFDFWKTIQKKLIS